MSVCESWIPRNYRTEEKAVEEPTVEAPSNSEPVIVVDEAQQESSVQEATHEILQETKVCAPSCAARGVCNNDIRQEHEAAAAAEEHRARLEDLERVHQTKQAELSGELDKVSAELAVRNHLSTQRPGF